MGAVRKARLICFMASDELPFPLWKRAFIAMVSAQQID